MNSENKPVLQSNPCPVCDAVIRDHIYSRERIFDEPLGSIEIKVAECLGCGFLFNDPRVADEFLNEYYSESLLCSGQIFRSQLSDGYYKIIHQRRAETVSLEYYSKFTHASAHSKTAHKNKSEPRLLDVGCGSGDFLSELGVVFPAYWRLAGIDPSQAAIDECEAKALTVRKGYLNEDDIVTDTYQIVTLVSVLEHVGSPKSLIKGIAQCLEDDGLLYIEVPNLLQAEFSLTGFFGLEHICHFTPHTLSILLERCGFCSIRFFDIHSKNICAVVSKRQIPDYQPLTDILDDRVAMHSIVLDYVSNERKFLKDLQNSVISQIVSWEKIGYKIGLYGAGQHSVELSSWVPLGRYISAVFDSDPRKHGMMFSDFVIQGPDKIECSDIQAILISSKPFELEIRGSILSNVQRPIEISGCYHHKYCEASS